MVMKRTPRPQMIIDRRRGGRHAIIIIREELQHSGGPSRSVEEEPRIGRDDHSHRYPRRPVEMLSPVEHHAVLLSSIASLIGLIQIMYQNRNDNPFQTHPATMAILVSTLYVNGVAAALLKSRVPKVKEEQQQGTMSHFGYNRILSTLIYISGVVSLACVVSVFIPDGLLRILYVVCATIFSALVVACDCGILCIFRYNNSASPGAEPSNP